MITLENYRGEFNEDSHSVVFILRYIKSNPNYKDEAMLEAAHFDTAFERDELVRTLAKKVNVRSSMHNQHWEEDEDEYLRKHFTLVTRVQMAKQLKRTFVAVVIRLRKMLGPTAYARGLKEEWKRFGRAFVNAEIEHQRRTTQVQKHFKKRKPTGKGNY